MTKTPHDNNYISNSFQNRIEVNLANISRSKDDKFILLGVHYIIKGFKCELCKHRDCLYAYTIKNVETNADMVVGSECIKHFKAKGCNIDLAAGLKKRVKSITRKMKRYMKKYLDKDGYKEMSVEQKRELTAKLFVKQQLKEQLRGESKKKVMLSEDEVLKILKYEE